MCVMFACVYVVCLCDACFCVCVFPRACFHILSHRAVASSRPPPLQQLGLNMQSPRLAWPDASDALASVFVMYALQHECGRSIAQSVARWQGCSVDDVTRDLSRFVCVPALDASDWSERPEVCDLIP